MSGVIVAVAPCGLPDVMIDGVVCCDCGGAVEAFGIPDAVWDGLGFEPGDFACVACVGRRVNPKLNPKHARHWLPKEIAKQKRRFGLGKPPFKCLATFLPVTFAMLVAKEALSFPREMMVSRG
jgi:hypothetical protein